MNKYALAFGTALSASLLATPAWACKNTANFQSWLNNYKSYAESNGISIKTVKKALGNVTLDPQVIANDRRQSVFAQSFLKFSGRMVSNYRLTHGKRRIKKYAGTFRRIEQKFGVPASVLVAFWGLETDFGVNMGKSNTVRSLATLAYDCRRPQLFKGQLLDALRLIDNGDLKAHEMVGAWAGEIGQMQFLPTEYMHTAVDFDGDGKRNLIKSVPDVLASSASLLKKFGWRRGQPWLQEVRAPANMPWEQADIKIKHSLSQWGKWGVTDTRGRPLKGGQRASLLLLMGRNGPAFLAYPNFNVYMQWNESLVYATTAAYFATRLAGKPKVNKGRGNVTPLSLAQTKKLQRKLRARGFNVGKIDGIIGANTRASVKAMQKKLGLPADSYPTQELLNKL